MSWATFHKQSEQLAAEAELALRAGQKKDAETLYHGAADAETKALESLDKGKTRTLGVTAVSAASLWYKSGDIRIAEQIALKYLLDSQMPSFAIRQLQYIVQTIWADLAREGTGVSFLPGQVFVAIRGGEVVHGGAPLDLIAKKVEGIQSLFYRTTEYLLKRPHRKRGAPEHQIQSICRPWLLQAAPSSYQFAVAIQDTPQPDLFEKSAIESFHVADTFLEIVRASVEAPEDALEGVIDDKDYRETFLKLTRNLAPTGKSFNEMEIKASAVAKPIRLVPEARKVISKAIRQLKGADDETAEVAPSKETLRGILRGLHLDKDWLELSVNDRHIRVNGVGETVDDVIGPMVNRNVIAEVRHKNGIYTLVDIESDD